jgi:hypothetical protein
LCLCTLSLEVPIKIPGFCSVFPHRCHPAFNPRSDPSKP